MKTPFPMEPVLAFCWIGFFLITGMILRAKVPFFRRYLIPSCLIGGTLGFVCNNLGMFSWLGLGVSDQTFQTLIYHMFNLTWIFLGLQKASRSAGQGKGKVAKMQMWMTGANIRVMAASAGLCVFAGIVMKGMGSGLPATVPVLTSLGFTGGPGQAMTVAAIWQPHGLPGLVDFSLAGASGGFLIAMIIGIPLVNILARRRHITAVTAPSAEEQKGYYGSNGPEAGRQTTASTSIDTLSWHIALALVAYIFAILAYLYLSRFLPPAIMQPLWAVFFVFCMLAGMVSRKIVCLFGVECICCANLNIRLSSLLVDYLACGTFITIQIGAVSSYTNYFIVSLIIASVVPVILLWWACLHLKDHAIERFGMMFGTLTGTISTGFILSRIVDPENRSSAAVDQGVSGLFCTPYFVLMALVQHVEIVYQRSPWLLVGFLLACVVVGHVLMLLARPERYKPGEPIEPEVEPEDTDCTVC